MSNSISPYSLDSIFAASPLGSLDKALSNNIRTFNVLQSPNALIPNQDQQGYIFLTRPQLNMQKDNIRNYAPLYGLLDDNPNGLGMAVRSLLDPYIQAGYSYRMPRGGTRFIQPLRCNLVDNRNAFIPFFTNNVITSSGWSDKVLPLSSTDRGLHQQTFPLIDGISRDYKEWDLSINIQNVRNDLSIATVATWIDYISLAKEGKFSPYFNFIVNNTIDSNTRVYRFVLDKNKEYVTKFAISGAAWPTTVPYGMFGDFDRNTPFNEQTKEISFRFRCMGQFWNDPRALVAFNGVVRCFNPSMADGVRETNMAVVPRAYLTFFNGKELYPRVHPTEGGLKLEWWTFKHVWDNTVQESDLGSYQDLFGVI